MLLLLLMISEVCHVIIHTGVLCRLYLPSEIKIKHNKWYFILDLLSAIICFMYVGNVYIFPIQLGHTIGHLFYIYGWNTNRYASRIQYWSSYEYTGKIITPDFFLTIFDIFTHGCLVYQLLLTFQ